MDLRNVKCPNCAGNNITEGSDNRFHCESCGSFFVVDAKPEDVEYQKLKVAEKGQEEFQKALLKTTFIRAVILIIIFLIFVLGIVLSIIFRNQIIQNQMTFSSQFGDGVIAAANYVENEFD